MPAPVRFCKKLFRTRHFTRHLSPLLLGLGEGHRTDTRFCKTLLQAFSRPFCSASLTPSRAAAMPEPRVGSWSTQLVRERTPQRLAKAQERRAIQSSAERLNEEVMDSTGGNARGGLLAYSSSECVPGRGSTRRLCACCGLLHPAATPLCTWPHARPCRASDGEGSDEEPLSIAGEELVAVPFPPRAGSVRGGSSRGGPPSSRTCTLLPVPLLPWAPWVELPPWLCPACEQRGGGAGAARGDRGGGGAAHQPRFHELATPTPGWLEVVRQPASSTTLDLSPESGAKGDLSDDTLAGAAKRACGSLRKLNLTACPHVSPQAILDVCRANDRMRTVRCARGAAWSAGAATQLLLAAPELTAFELDLACRRLEEPMQALLREPAVRCRQLTCINKMAPEFAAQVLAPLLVTATLRRLVLAGTCIGPAGAAAVAASLSPSAKRPTQPMSPLRYLSLRGCRLGVAGAKALASLLRVNPVLRGLDLGHNRMGDEGVIELAHALTRARGKNDTLKELSLARNGISLESAKHLAEMLGDNTSLEVFSVADNDMGPAAGRLLAMALRRNRGLQQFYGQGNTLGDAAGREFVTSLRGHKRLWKLELHNNELQPGTSHELSVLTLKAMLRGEPGYDWEMTESFDYVAGQDGDSTQGDGDAASDSDSGESQDGASADSEPQG